MDVTEDRDFRDVATGPGPTTLDGGDGAGAAGGDGGGACALPGEGTVDGVGQRKGHPRPMAVEDCKSMSSASSRAGRWGSKVGWHAEGSSMSMSVVAVKGTRCPSWRR